ncbi:hypothetical protein GCM10010392_29540 [Streptomyces clavifer]|nr:hypothetical protein GCM10010392_29540 [Streptomyces clavifer]
MAAPARAAVPAVPVVPDANAAPAPNTIDAPRPAATTAPLTRDMDGRRECWNVTRFDMRGEPPG